MSLWKRLTGRNRRKAVEREIEEERMSPSERRIATEGIENYAADQEAKTHLGGFDPNRLLDK